MAALQLVTSRSIHDEQRAVRGPEALTLADDQRRQLPDDDHAILIKQTVLLERLLDDMREMKNRQREDTIALTKSHVDGQSILEARFRSDTQGLQSTFMQEIRALEIQFKEDSKDKDGRIRLLEAIWWKLVGAATLAGAASGFIAHLFGK